MVDWFGSTHYGTGNPIRDMIRADFAEPSSDLSLEERMRNSAKTSVMDCYLERVDGFAYGSQDRLKRMRKKGLFKTVGPIDMYKYPGLASMDYGWHISDLDLKKATWYRPAKSFAMPKTEISKFLEFALALDKFFKF